MPNANYVAGRRFEYERAKHWRSIGHEVMRTAGSHGLFDLITISTGGDIQLLQLKRVSNVAEAQCFLARFAARPPLGHRTRARYHQVLEIRVRGHKGISTVRV